MKIEGVVFDLFGTIIPRPDRSLHRKMLMKMAAVLEMDIDDYQNLWLATYKDRISGMGNNSSGFMKYMMSKASIIDTDSSSVELSSLWYDFTKDLISFFPDVIPAFQAIRSQGIKIGLLTNCGPNVPPLISESEIAKYLDGAVYSSDSGIVKPDLRIYNEACLVLNTCKERTVFIGDGDNKELPGARDAGLISIKIDRGDIAGDYQIDPNHGWDPTIPDLTEIMDRIHSFGSTFSKI